MKSFKQMLTESENKHLDKMLTLDSIDKDRLNRNLDKKTLSSLDFYLNNIEANFNLLLSYLVHSNKDNGKKIDISRIKSNCESMRSAIKGIEDSLKGDSYIKDNM